MSTNGNPSKPVEDFSGTPNDQDIQDGTPILRRLSGILPLFDPDEERRVALESKYLGIEDRAVSKE